MKALRVSLLVLMAAALLGAGAGTASTSPGPTLPRSGRILGLVPALGVGLPGLLTNLMYHGGPVMHTNKVYAIYWVPPGYSTSANYRNLIVKRARMEGFLVLDYLDRFPEAQLEMFGWVAEGKVKHAEHVVEGLEHAPDALNLLFTGGNTGKIIVKV